MKLKKRDDPADAIAVGFANGPSGGEISVVKEDDGRVVIRSEGEVTDTITLDPQAARALRNFLDDGRDKFAKLPAIAEKMAAALEDILPTLEDDHGPCAMVLDAHRDLAAYRESFIE